jgi:glycine amidinotransferase
MPLECRKDAWKSLLDPLGTTIIVPCKHKEELYNENCVGDKDTLALTEVTPAFDAANIIRANDDVLYLVSNSGNLAGAKILQEMLRGRAKVHLLQGVYSYMHIDTTIAFLREGLMLLNPERIKSVDVLPEPFRNWDVVWCPEPVDIGYYPGYNHASEWINMNLFSVSPNLVALEEHQEPTRKELEKHGIECAMLPMRHSRTLSGCFHCVTLDLERE